VRAGQNEPDVHATWVVGVEQKDPAAQSVHVSFEVARAAAENVPVGHSAHVSFEVARVAAEYVPAGHPTCVAGVAHTDPAAHARSLVERAGQ